MRLKYVELKGFRAYKDITVVHLDGGSNAVVGLNGSGKSSLLEAICLVVSEVYGRRNINSKHIIHKGARHSLMSAYVELCFDNSDRTLSLFPKDEVKLRRSFFLGDVKKDQFLVDGRGVTKSEFVALLEAGGFTKTNPYYVVRQGKVIEMSMMTDEGRLKLLKDFSGVQVYEDKCSQAQKTLNDLQEKTIEIDTIIADLGEKLTHLEKQQQTLQLYTSYSTDKDLLTVLLIDRETGELRKELEETREALEIATIGLESQRGILDDLSAKEEAIRNKAEEDQKQRDILDNEIDLLNQQLKEIGTRQNELLLKIDKLNNTIQKEQDIRTGSIDTIKKLEKEKLLRYNRLTKEIEPKCNELRSSIERIDKERIILNEQAELLEEKRERCEKFKSIIERNSHIQKIRIPDLHKRKDIVERKLTTVITDLTSAEKEHERIVNQIKQLENDQKNNLKNSSARDTILAKLDSCQQALTSTGIQLENAKTLLRREELILTKTAPCDGLLSQLESAHRTHTWRGNLIALRWDADKRQLGLKDDLEIFMDVLDRVKLLNMDSHHELPAVVGPIWTILDVDVKWQKAVSAALGAAVENLVCSSDSVGSEIYKVLQQYGGRALGRSRASVIVTPYDQLALRRSHENSIAEEILRHSGVCVCETARDGPETARDRGLLDLDEVKAVPLSAVVGCPEGLKAPLLNQLCGRTALVASLEIGKELLSIARRRHAEIDCVTADGDIVTSRGTVAGGHRDAAKDCLALASRLNGGLKMLDQQKRLISQLKLDILKLEQRHEEELANLSATKVELAACEEVVCVSGGSFSEQLQQSLLSQEALIGNLTSMKFQQETVLSNLTMKIEQLEQLVRSGVKENITRKELSRLQELDEKMLSLSRERSELAQMENDYETTRLSLVRQVNELGREITRLNERILARQEYPSATDDGPVRLKTLKMELEELRRIESLRMTELNQFRSDKSKESHSVQIQDELILAKKQTLSDIRQFEHQTDVLQMTLKDIQEKLKQKSLIRQRIISSNAFSDQTIVSVSAETNTDVSNLKHEIQKISDKISQLPPLNKKAVDDLQSFKNEYVRASEQRVGLMESLAKVKELMGVLNGRRSVTLRRAFDEVNANLQRVFMAIVPGGRVKMVIQKMSKERISEMIKNKKAQQCRQMGVPASPLDTTGASGASGGTAGSRQTWELEISDGQDGMGENEEMPHWDEIATGIQLKASFKRTVAGEDDDVRCEDDEEDTDEGVSTSRHQYFPLMALSGGQKTVLALSLIFAMQRCDKAPFYILDEVDAALDESYRSALANLIKESSDKNQFILTTFRRELCEVCDKHFQVTNQGREAHVEEISVEQALDVILESTHSVGSEGLLAASG